MANHTLVLPGPCLERVYRAHDVRGGWWECYDPRPNVKPQHSEPRMYAVMGTKGTDDREVLASFPLPMRERDAHKIAERIGLPRSAYL